MKKFLLQQVNFVYAVIVMLALTIGVGFVGAAAGSSDPGPNTISPLIHQGGGEQAMSGLAIGSCGGGSCLGKLDVRGNLNNISIFDSSVNVNPMFMIMQNVGILGKLFIGDDSSPGLALWTRTYGTESARFTIPLQRVNVYGNARATNLANTTPNAPVCVDRQGTLKLCVESPPANPVCGVAHGKSYRSFPTSPELCASGTQQDFQEPANEFRWKCFAINGGTPEFVQCKASRIQDGLCHNFGPGPFNRDPSTTANGCDDGSYVDTPDSSTQWKWDCQGVRGGTSVSCTAPGV